MSTLAALIRQRLVDTLEASAVDVVDDSASHAGHGASGAHVKIVVTSPRFAGKSSLERHRMVNAAFREELKGPIHALQIVARAPGET